MPDGTPSRVVLAQDRTKTTNPHLTSEDADCRRRADLADILALPMQPWQQVDDHLADLFDLEDDALRAALEATVAAGLPQIQASAVLGRFLQLQARAIGARRILEIGTLAGYSTIWMARALPADGRLVTLDLDPRHAEVARANLARAGLDGIAEVRVGPALDSLAELAEQAAEPFDMVFIDADKEAYPDYLEWSMRLAHPGTLIVADNVVRGGQIVDASSTDSRVQGIRAFNEKLATDRRLLAGIVQTVGAKGHDGMALALVLEKLTSLRRVPLLALYAADAISVTGNVMALVAIPWFVLELTGSAALTGVTAFFSTLAAVIAAFFGGTLVDRVGFRAMSVISDIASAIAIAAIPVLFLTIGVQPWMLMALVFLGALLDAPGTAARSSMLPDLATLSGTPIERAASVSQAVRRGATLVGAPLAGILIVAIGTPGVLLLDAITFLVSAALVGLLTPSLARHEEAPAEGEALPKRGRYLDELKDGLRFVWRDRLVRAIVLTVMITNFLDAPLLSVVLPVYVHQVYGSAVDLGLLFGAFGGAALAGAIGYGVIGPRLPRRLTFGIAFVIVGLPMWLLVFQPPFIVALLGFVVIGLAAGPINPIISSVIFERVPRSMRGRVLGTITSGAWIAIPAGMLIAGFVSEQFGVITAVAATAAAYLLVTLSIFLVPAMREMDRAPAAPAVPPA